MKFIPAELVDAVTCTAFKPFVCKYGERGLEGIAVTTEETEFSGKKEVSAFNVFIYFPHILIF